MCLRGISKAFVPKLDWQGIQPIGNNNEWNEETENIFQFTGLTLRSRKWAKYYVEMCLKLVNGHEWEYEFSG